MKRYVPRNAPEWLVVISMLTMSIAVWLCSKDIYLSMVRP